MQATFTTNSQQFSKAIVSYIAAFRVNAREAVRLQARLLGERLVKLTPPRSLSQGRKAVDRDIRRVILGLDSMPDNPSNVIKGDDSVAKAFVSKGVVYGVDRKQYQPNLIENAVNEFRQSHRNRRGRVHKDAAPTRNMGEWRLLTKFVVPLDKLRHYIRSVQAGVGRGKGGWARGVLALGGKVPGWIEAHAADAGGFNDGTNSADPFFEFINESEWASGGDQDRIMENALKARVRDIEKSIRLAHREAGKGLGVT